MLHRLLLACCLTLTACGAADTTTAVSGLQYLGQMRVWPGATLDGTVIGGLSGISYDPASQLYYVISDDRSAKNPARFYTARISLSANGIDDVEFVATHPWLDKDGKPFRPLDTDAAPPVIPPDPEGIAVDTRRQRLYWSSEGERATENAERPALLDTWVRIAGLDGGYRGEFVLPPVLDMSSRRLRAAPQPCDGGPDVDAQRHLSVRRHGRPGLQRRRGAHRKQRRTDPRHPVRCRHRKGHRAVRLPARSGQRGTRWRQRAYGPGRPGRPELPGRRTGLRHPRRRSRLPRRGG